MTNKIVSKEEDQYNGVDICNLYAIELLEGFGVLAPTQSQIDAVEEKLMSFYKLRRDQEGG